MSEKVIELFDAQSRETLSEIYSNYTKEDVIKIAKIHHIKKYSSLKKEELIEHVVSGILDINEMRDYFLLLKDVEYNALERVIQGAVTLTEDNSGEYERLLSGGYLALSYDMNVVVPVDVLLAWNSLNTVEFNKERKRANVISEFCYALNFLYGVTPLNILLEIFNRYENTKLSEEELLKFYDIMSKYDDEFQLIDNKFVDSNLLENDQYLDFIKHVEGKSYFVPSRDMISTLGNEFNNKISEELYALYELLGNKYQVEEVKLVQVCGYIEENIRLGCTLEHIFQVLNSLELPFTSQAEVNEMQELVSNLWNNTRMISNLGFTNNELTVISSNITPKVVPFRKEEQKVYPNEPCPCGSGKKYKKCCANK